MTSSIQGFPFLTGDGGASAPFASHWAA